MGDLAQERSQTCENIRKSGLPAELMPDPSRRHDTAGLGPSAFGHPRTGRRVRVEDRSRLTEAFRNPAGQRFLRHRMAIADIVDPRAGRSGDQRREDR